MSVEQLIAEFKALPQAERRRVAYAVLSDEGSWLPDGQAPAKESVGAPAKEAAFSERWTGKFALPKLDPEDVRLTFLLDRFSA